MIKKNPRLGIFLCPFLYKNRRQTIKFLTPFPYSKNKHFIKIHKKTPILCILGVCSGSETEI
jgi:hypothetical protein